MSFVDDVNAATAADHLIVAMAQLQRLKGVLDLHIDNLFERRMSQNARRVYKCATGLPYWPKLPEKKHLWVFRHIWSTGELAKYRLRDQSEQLIDRAISMKTTKYPYKIRILSG